MALLTDWGDHNKIETELLCKRFLVSDAVTYVAVEDGAVVVKTAYTVTRYATKRYSYVGMTKDAARRCAAEKTAKYTRRRAVATTVLGYIKSTLSDDGTVSSEVLKDIGPCVYVNGQSVAEVVASSSDGVSYDVSISVNETDTVVVENTPTASDSCFGIDFGDYDE